MPCPERLSIDGMPLEGTIPDVDARTFRLVDIDEFLPDAVVETEVSPLAALAVMSLRG